MRLTRVLRRCAGVDVNLLLDLFALRVRTGRLAYGPHNRVTAAGGLTLTTAVRWSTGVHLTTPRTDGRLPFHRIRPAPQLMFACSAKRFITLSCVCSLHSAHFYIYHHLPPYHHPLPIPLISFIILFSPFLFTFYLLFSSLFILYN